MEFYNYKDNSVIDNTNGNIPSADPMFTSVVPVVHMPKGFDTATGYDSSWYETKTVADGTTPNTWTQAANAIAAGWYPGAVYDVNTYGLRLRAER